ncbi:rare lipoprotein A [Micromonospora sp. Llam0]|uniref:septal ring lytic transglycosylase RlpA family protein n=1 Tax=Micromonospora sp. Llam0 TaxID=2485143 RepID=UPI000F472A7C|nr:septal ring lytic transglycosylase RlpA family protein [Micromonospora sp. Llam0]ROO52386.1 rare lipoprotein A [Micromonospora sp. Llam0]
MAARHRNPRPYRLRLAPWLAVFLLVGVLAGGTAMAFELTAGTSTTPPAASTAAPPTAAPPTTTPSAAASGADRSTASTRAARGADRAASTPKPSPTPEPPPTQSEDQDEDQAAGQAQAGGQVVESGTCGASYYASGHVTANGEPFDPSGMTAAHRTLPFGTQVRVTNPQTGASVVVRINDRGPFVDGRCLDLARAAFAKIAALDLGHLQVRYEILGD